MNREELIAAAIAAYPTLERVSPTTLRGPLRVVDRFGREYTFQMEIEVPLAFPNQAAHPQAQIIKHDLPREPTVDAHVMKDGWLCVQMGPRNEIHYADVGLVGFIDQVVLHLDRIRIWALTRRYPGPAYAHGDDGLREYERELADLRARHRAEAARLGPAAPPKPGPNALKQRPSRVPPGLKGFLRGHRR